MKKYLLLLTVTFCFFAGKSQHKNQLYIHTGYTVPTGKFASASSNSNGSFATSRYGLTTGYNRNLKRFYFGAQLGIFGNGFSNEKYDDRVRRNTSRNITSSTLHRGYGLFAINATLGYDFYKDSSLSIGGHLRPGIGFFVASDLENTVVDANTFVTTHSGFAKEDVVYAFGFKVEKLVSKNFSLTAGVDYIFKTVTETTDHKGTINNTPFVDGTRDIEMGYGNLFFLVGISYGFSL